MTSAGCDCVWVGSGVLASACAAHDAWRNISIELERMACANIADRCGDDESRKALGVNAAMNARQIAHAIRNRAPAQI